MKFEDMKGALLNEGDFLKCYGDGIESAVTAIEKIIKITDKEITTVEIWNIPPNKNHINHEWHWQLEDLKYFEKVSNDEAIAIMI